MDVFVRKRLKDFWKRSFHHMTALAAIFILLALGNAVRAPDIADGIGVQNLEAPWHVLLTVEAMRETPPGQHWFLPIVTLGNPADRGIPWGATVPDRSGHYYYTSSTAPTFFLPYLWFQAFGLEPTIANLAGFNFVTQIVFVLSCTDLSFNSCVGSARGR